MLLVMVMHLIVGDASVSANGTREERSLAISGPASYGDEIHSQFAQLSASGLSEEPHVVLVCSSSRPDKLHEAPLPVPGGEPPGTTNIYGEDEDEAGYEIVQQPCEPTPPTSSKLERLSKHDKTSSSRSSSSKSLPPVSDCGSGGIAQKRKASLSEGSSHRSSKPKSKGKDYWEQEAESGRYFHEHSDGRITWADE
ncbi:hypothetical protein B0T21DRAFT_414214 [Apiosordaria backusii]|uniref:Uncharacterized protein n=1 Tax=Apiosordaria backusii TaxID=314023 RepID=A0AA40AXM0_9PEZI|nr:hypothetical protein B0T21DRAFT_414214 [Apiosordaria backusii]